MANHPNRPVPTPEPTTEYLVQASAVLLTNISKLMKLPKDTEEFERGRKQTFRSARDLVKALQLMGPPAAAEASE
jgi:hypothetical protein